MLLKTMTVDCRPDKAVQWLNPCPDMYCMNAACCWHRVDEKSDVYSLGCILYECIARSPPFHYLSSNEDRSLNLMYKVGGVKIHYM